MHDYAPARLRFATDQIRQRADAESTLLDIGCGTGSLLALLESETGISHLTGMDVSANALKVSSQRVACTTLQASILDPDLATSIPDRFDFVVLAAVLHHLVGRSRRRSRQLVATALETAMSLLTDDGHLVIVEPTFTPRWAMDTMFFTKKQVTRFTASRVEILGTWNNIGAPVVSYYSPDELRELLADAGADVVEFHNAEGKLRRLPRRLGITGRWDTTIIARRSTPH